ncbi:MAG: hypothetical protein WC767_01025 [Candidatus Paceibacterota bacterium]
MKIDINKFKDDQLVKLVDSRWNSSATLWDTVTKTYEKNTKIYQNEGEWIARIPVKLRKVLANRIFPNMEAVINSVIANPPSINFIPGRLGPESQALARKEENYFRKKYRDLNVKEALRMGLRNLYFGRLIVEKVFWNPKINDFDVRAIDPRKVRFGKYARREEDSEFAIEEIDDNICSLLERFPKAADAIKKKYSIEDEADAYIKNQDVTYKEAWIGDYVIFKLDNIILGVIRNPYFDWDGLLITDEEEQQINSDPDKGGLIGEQRRDLFMKIKLDQDNRRASQVPKMASPEVETDAPEGFSPVNADGEPQIPPNEGHTEPITYKAYNFNYFNQARKPYVYATILNNENQPIGRTDFITMAETLQESIDKRKQDIGQNCELVNGIIKVDSEVMDKESAQQLAYEAKGVIWGKGVAAGVSRETGEPLPEMVYNDMIDSRNEIDNIMAASSAFRGEREGQETKAGRLALIQQSFLRLNELVQCVDFVCGEIFAWFYQLAKTRYTERHYAKWVGKDEATEILDLIQDDFETGSEIQVIPGKTLPEDAEFRFDRAQKDVAAGILSPVDYMEEAGYPNPKDLARNAVLYKQNPAAAVGLSPDKMPLPAQPGTLQPDQELAVMEAMGMGGLMGGGAVTPASAVAP